MQFDAFFPNGESPRIFSDMANPSRLKGFSKSIIIAPLVLGAIGGLVWYGVSRTKNHSSSRGEVAHSEHGDSDHEAGVPERDHPSGGHQDHEVADHGTSEASGHAARSAHRAPKRQVASDHQFVTSALPSQSILPTEAAPDIVCSRAEYKGSGVTEVKVDSKEWGQVMDAFHGAKGDLLAWLEEQVKHHPEALSGDLRKFLETEVREIRVQRPPSPEEPDLAYRGVLVMSEDRDGVPLIRVGSGMLALLKDEPKRARFEFTRVIAQRWAPCALAGSGGEKLWSTLMGCSGLQEDWTTACAAGGFSESGWMTSTALAARVTPPGCKVVGVSELQASCGSASKAAPHHATAPAGGHETRKPASTPHHSEPHGEQKSETHGEQKSETHGEQKSESHGGHH